MGTPVGRDAYRHAIGAVAEPGLRPGQRGVHVEVVKRFVDGLESKAVENELTIEKLRKELIQTRAEKHEEYAKAQCLEKELAEKTEKQAEQLQAVEAQILDCKEIAKKVFALSSSEVRAKLEAAKRFAADGGCTENKELLSYKIELLEAMESKHKDWTAGVEGSKKKRKKTRETSLLDTPLEDIEPKLKKLSEKLCLLVEKKKAISNGEESVNPEQKAELDIEIEECSHGVSVLERLDGIAKGASSLVTDVLDEHIKQLEQALAQQQEVLGRRGLGDSEEEKALAKAGIKVLGDEISSLKGIVTRFKVGGPGVLAEMKKCLETSREVNDSYAKAVLSTIQVLFDRGGSYSFVLILFLPELSKIIGQISSYAKMDSSAIDSKIKEESERRDKIKSEKKLGNQEEINQTNISLMKSEILINWLEKFKSIHDAHNREKSVIGTACRAGSLFFSPLVSLVLWLLEGAAVVGDSLLKLTKR